MSSPPCLVSHVRTVPNNHFSVTVCLRQPVPLRELSMLNVAGCMVAGPMLATSFGGCSSATGCARPTPNYALKIRSAKHVANKFLRCAGRRDGASRRRRLLRGEGAQNKGCWRVQKVHVGELLQQPWSRSAMAQEWRAVVRGVHSARVCGACALAHSTHPFAGCMAGREDVARHEALKKTRPQ